MYKREVIPFTTQEAWLNNRTKDITSSDVPVLFGCGYQSYDSLVENKRNGTSSIIEQTEEMSWGKALESAIAEEFARRNKWIVRHKTEYIRIPELRLGSSYDYEIEGERDTYDEWHTYTELLEIKVVNEWKFKKDWIQGFEIQATPYIELQLQNELLVSGLEIGYIGALIGCNRGILLRREAKKKIHDAILIKVAKFWEDVNK